MLGAGWCTQHPATRHPPPSTLHLSVIALPHAYLRGCIQENGSGIPALKKCSLWVRPAPCAEVYNRAKVAKEQQDHYKNAIAFLLFAILYCTVLYLQANSSTGYEVSVAHSQLVPPVSIAYSCSLQALLARAPCTHHMPLHLVPQSGAHYRSLPGLSVHGPAARMPCLLKLPRCSLTLACARASSPLRPTASRPLKASTHGSTTASSRYRRGHDAHGKQTTQGPWHEQRHLLQL